MNVRLVLNHGSFNEKIGFYSWVLSVKLQSLVNCSWWKIPNNLQVAMHQAWLAAWWCGVSPDLIWEAVLWMGPRAAFAELSWESPRSGIQKIRLILTWIFWIILLFILGMSIVRVFRKGNSCSIGGVPWLPYSLVYHRQWILTSK